MCNLDEPQRNNVDAADLRASVDMSVKLSTQLMATAVGVLTVEGALFAFVLTYRVPNFLFFVCGLFAAVALITSIFKGGKGITQARDAGFAGKWNVESSKESFNFQAGFALSGLVLLVVTLGFGLSSPFRIESTLAEIGRLRTEFATLQASIGNDQTGIKNELLAQKKDLAKLASVATLASQCPQQNQPNTSALTKDPKQTR